MHALLVEILGSLWTARGREPAGLGERVMDLPSAPSGDPFEAPTAEGAEARAAEQDTGGADLSPRAEGTERGIVRRRRLAETLFLEVLDLPARQAEASSRELEHQLSEPVVDAVCAFLGHPPLCPHGKPIPRGDCCRRFNGKVRPLIVPLTEVAPGRGARIRTIASGEVQVLERLGSLGVTPGARVQVRRRRPAVVLRIGETVVALDRSLARRIYVREE